MLREQIRSDSPAQEATARGEAKGARVGADEPKVLELRHGILIEDLRQLTEDQRLIETQAQHHTLAPSDLDRKRLNLTVRSRSGPERRPSVGQAHERIEKITVDGYRKACSDRDGKHVVGDTVHVGFMAVDLGADHDRYRETTAVSP